LILNSNHEHVATLGSACKDSSQFAVFRITLRDTATQEFVGEVRSLGVVRSGPLDAILLQRRTIGCRRNPSVSVRWGRLFGEIDGNFEIDVTANSLAGGRKFYVKTAVSELCREE